MIRLKVSAEHLALARKLGVDSWNVYADLVRRGDMLIPGQALTWRGNVIGRIVDLEKAPEHLVPESPVRQAAGSNPGFRKGRSVRARGSRSGPLLRRPSDSRKAQNPLNVCLVLVSC